MKTELKNKKTELKNLEAHVQERIALRAKILERKAQADKECREVKAKIDRDALAVFTDGVPEEIILADYERLRKAELQLDIASRAEISISQQLSDSAPQEKISRLRREIQLLEHRNHYQDLLDQLDQKYDRELERELVEAARDARITDQIRDQAVIGYRRKHGIPAAFHDPLKLRPEHQGIDW